MPNPILDIQKSIAPQELNQERDQPLSSAEYLQTVLPRIAAIREFRLGYLTQCVRNIQIAQDSLRKRSFETIKALVREETLRTTDKKMLRANLTALLSKNSNHPLMAQKDADLKEITDLDQKYKEELSVVETSNPEDYALKIYLPKLLKKDVDDENIAGLKEWAKTYPQAFALDPELLIQAIELAVNKDLDLLAELLSAFEKNQDPFPAPTRLSIKGNLSKVAIEAAENHQYPLLKVILNATESEFIDPSALHEIIRFGLDTQNENLISTVIHSSQFRWIREETQQILNSAARSENSRIQPQTDFKALGRMFVVLMFTITLAISQRMLVAGFSDL